MATGISYKLHSTIICLDARGTIETNKTIHVAIPRAVVV